MNDLDVDERLRTDAARWNAARPPGPELEQMIERLTTGATPRRPSWHRRAVAIAAAALTVAAIAIVAEQFRSKDTSAANGKQLITCGTEPTSGGPYASRVVVTLSAPSSAISGDTIYPKLSIRSSGARILFRIVVSQPAPVYIIRHGQIVGRYSGLIAGTGLGMTVTREPATIPAASVQLSGCSQGRVDLADPNAGRQPLPPGRYQLVATLVGNGSEPWQLVSEPTDITIVR